VEDCDKTHHDRDEHPGNPLGQIFHRTLLTLGLAHGSNDLLDHRLVSQLLHPHNDRSAEVHGSCQDLVSWVLLRRFRFSGERRLVEGGGSSNDGSVGGRERARLDEDEIVDLEVVDGDEKGGDVAYS